MPASGAPFIDLAHVFQCLAKVGLPVQVSTIFPQPLPIRSPQLDAQSPERACLMSPDGKNIMVVAYRDLARCLDNAFEELVNAGARAGDAYGGGRR